MRLLKDEYKRLDGNSMISIIIPVYNVEKYLEQCVDSLLNQTYSNTEIILVDDGSTDGSGAICDKYKELDARVVVIHKENAGPGYARNTGLEVAQGDYVVFADSDDYADEQMIEELFKTRQKHKADTCIGGYIKVKDNGEVFLENSYLEQVYQNEECVQLLLARMIGSIPERSDAIRQQVWNVLYSMDIIRRNDIKFPSEREYYSEDLMFDFRYFQHSSCVVLSPTMYYRYRENPDSFTLKYNPDKFNASKKVYRALLIQISEMNFLDQTVLRVQRSFLVAIRACVHQENTTISKLNYKTAKRNLMNICSDKDLQELMYNYPIKRMELKQRVFCELLKYKATRTLYACTKLKII